MSKARRKESAEASIRVAAAERGEDEVHPIVKDLNRVASETWHNIVIAYQKTGVRPGEFAYAVIDGPNAANEMSACFELARSEMLCAVTPATGELCRFHFTDHGALMAGLAPIIDREPASSLG